MNDWRKRSKMKIKIPRIGFPAACRGEHQRIAGVSLPGILALAALMLLPAGCGKAGAGRTSQVLARVNGREITVSAFRRQVRELPPEARKFAESAGQAALLNSMIDRELLYQEAKRKRLNEDPDTKGRIEDAEKDVLAAALIERQTAGKTAVSADEARLYYNSHPSEFRDVPQVRLSRIVVPDAKDAARLLAELKKGGDFGRLAALYSIDRRSAARGGDTGYFAYGQVPAAIRDEVLHGAKPGMKRDGPVVLKTASGYAIYRITGRRAVTYPFDGTEGAIEKHLAGIKFGEAVRALADRLRERAKIEINRKIFKSGLSAGWRR